VLALAGYLIAIWFPPPYEFVAFVRAGSLGRDDIVPKADVLDGVNGLSTASEVARRLEGSPWLVWRKYGVTAEGAIYVVRVRDADPDRGSLLIAAVRDTLVSDLGQRYDAAMNPHRAYIAALEQEVVRLGAETARLDAAGFATGAGAARTGVDRRVALAEIRKQLRDAQVSGALSGAPTAVGDVRRLDPDRRARQILLTLTGAVIGFAAAAAALVILAFRARSSHAFAGA
jgi:hypothetical protein